VSKPIVLVNGSPQETTAPDIGAATGTSLDVTGALHSGGTAGVGYHTGAGGTVTQVTSKGTTVTLNKCCGEITTHNANLAAGAAVTFTLSNSTIAVGDVLVMNMAYFGSGALGAYLFSARCVAGAAAVNIRNVSGGDLAEAIVIRFAVIKGALS
jgi:hypothetical protein